MSGRYFGSNITCICRGAIFLQIWYEEKTDWENRWGCVITVLLYFTLLNPTIWTSGSRVHCIVLVSRWIFLVRFCRTTVTHIFIYHFPFTNSNIAERLETMEIFLFSRFSLRYIYKRFRQRIFQLYIKTIGLHATKWNEKHTYIFGWQIDTLCLFIVQNCLIFAPSSDVIIRYNSSAI